MENKHSVKVPNKSGGYVKAVSQDKDKASPTVKKGGDLRSGNSSK